MAFSFNNNSILVNGELIADAKAYESDMQRLLNIIMDSSTGAILLRFIAATGKHLLIVPYKPEKGGVCNANSSPVAGSNLVTKALSYYVFGHASKASAKGKPVSYDKKGKPGSESGSGEGANSTIRFTPSSWGATGVCSPGMPGATAVGVLFHEMVHSYRHMSGKRWVLPSKGANVLYGDLEEFMAIVVSNVFAADPTTKIVTRTLRHHHQGFVPLPQKQHTSAGFVSVKENRESLDILRRQEPDLCKALAGVNAPFNPFAALR